MTFERQSKLAGAPIHYDRLKPEDYGTIGIPIDPYFDPDFYEQCNQAFVDIQALLKPKLGPFTAVVTGGIGRAGEGASYHHKNRAFDLDALFFESGASWVATSYRADPHLYLAIESRLRMHFGTVLTYLYDPRHEDHFHFDNGRASTFRPATKTHSLFVQAAIKHLFFIEIGVDGVWGPDTESKARLVRQEMGLGPLSRTDNWIAFCREVGNAAAARVAPPAKPSSGGAACG
jgi:hypothetical protein